MFFLLKTTADLTLSRVEMSGDTTLSAKDACYKVKVFKSSSDGEEVSWRRNVLIHKQLWNFIFIALG